MGALPTQPFRSSHSTCSFKIISECCYLSLEASNTHAPVQALLLKASVAPTEAMASVVMKALSMLRQDPSRYEVLSMAAQLLQRVPLSDRAPAGVTLEVSVRLYMSSKRVDHLAC